jgi:hypothetical protein
MILSSSRKEMTGQIPWFTEETAYFSLPERAREEIMGGKIYFCIVFG